MGTGKILETLSPIERDILPHLKDGAELKEISKLSGRKEVEVMRGLQWLENKGLIRIESSSKSLLELGPNGKIYREKGMPERRFLEALGGKMTIEEIKKAAGLNDDEVRVSIGILKSKYAITVMGGEIEPTGKKENILDEGLPEEDFMKRLPMEIGEMKEGEKSVMKRLMKRRGMINRNVVKRKHVKMTETGKKILRESGNLRLDLIEKLTPRMLKERSWKGKTFRKYDVEINVPRFYGGRRHFVSQAVDYAKRVWLELGFKEMTGPLIQTSFWNFDALFTAQDHPVRDLQDTFFIKDPRKGRLPDRKTINAVRSAHENGGKTGSRGWQYDWDKENARMNVMRTHTTCLSAKAIASLRASELPAKYFAVGKCFRNETMDWSHLFEFNQFEGIVVDPGANFRHLLGYLKNFANKIGFDEVRFRPAHFPYTEPSVEGEVFDPVHGKWIEVFAAGIFRPEVVVPLLGKDVPVLAWGPGLDRMTLSYYGISDLRELYSNDIKQLREMKMWLR